jgi:hypothetical protein
MKIYFAGVPAGLQRTREEGLEEMGITDRLITFFYTKKALITLKHFREADVDYSEVRDNE